MLKIRENGIIESFENGIEGVNEILFTVSDETVIKEIFKESKFKYRPVDEYIFNELEVYKLYNSNSEGELFNIVRLLPNEIEYYKELLLLIGINFNSDELKFKIKNCLIKNEYILQELTIECVNDIETFAKLATAETNVMEHSWAGSSGNNVIFELISGEIEFGINSCYEYSNNGNISSPEFERKIVDFNTLSEIAFLRIENKFDSYNEKDLNEYYYTLVLFNCDVNSKTGGLK